MRRIDGLTDEQVATFEERIEAVVRVELQRIMDVIADRIASIVVASVPAMALVGAVEEPPPPGQPYVSPDDLAPIAPMWGQVVAEQILPIVGEVWLSSAGAVYRNMVSATNIPNLPSVGSLAAETYLRSARNTFEEIADNLWGHARQALSEGFEAGDSIPQLAQRLRGAAPVTARTATLVARTQVIEASNAGSIATARVSGLEMRKVWFATPDTRTRPTHLAAEEVSERNPVPLNQPFMVGGFPADFPADPDLPPSERYSCRCAIGYVMTEAATKQAQRASVPEQPLPNTSGMAEPPLPDVVPEPGPLPLVDPENLRGTSALSRDPLVRDVQVDNRVRWAYQQLAAQPGARVRISDMRPVIGRDLPDLEVAEAMRRVGRIERDRIVVVDTRLRMLPARAEIGERAPLPPRAVVPPRVDIGERAPLPPRAVVPPRVDIGERAPLPPRARIPGEAPGMATPGPDVAPEGFEVARAPQPRASLRRARDSRAFALAMQAEMREITGRDIPVYLPPGASMATMRELGEGVLRSLERFPDAKLRSVTWFDNVGAHYAEVDEGNLAFNAWWVSEDRRPALLRALRGDVSGWGEGRAGWSVRGAGNATTLAEHEFGHIIDMSTLAERTQSAALTLVRRRAAAEGIADDTLVARDISIYATSDGRELMAEAFADVMSRGAVSSALSREIFDLMEAEYRRIGGTLGDFVPPGQAAFATPAAGGLNALTVARLKVLAKERGIAVPAGAKKADIVRLLDGGDAPTPVVAVDAVDLSRVADVPALGPMQLPALREYAARIGLTVPPRTTADRLRQMIQTRIQLRDQLAGQLDEQTQIIAEAAERGASARALAAKLRAQMRRLRVDPVDANGATVAGPDLPIVGYVWRRPGGDVRLDGTLPAGLSEAERLEFAAANRLARRALDAEGVPAGRQVEVPSAPPSPAQFDARLESAARGDAALSAATVPLRTAAERKAYADYVSKYRHVNGALRDNGGQIPASRDFALERRVTTGLDSAMARSGLSEDVFVHRIAGTYEFPNGRPAVGAEWTDHGFVSTSAQPKYGAGRGEVVMRILAPRGTRAVATPELDVNEVLLDRGSRFRVVKVDEPDAAGVWHLDVEAISARLPDALPSPTGLVRRSDAAFRDTKDLQTRARLRQIEIDAARGYGNLAVELDELVQNGASRRALLHAVNSAGRKHGLPESALVDLRGLVDDPAALRSAARAQAGRQGIELPDTAGASVRFDRARHAPVGADIPDGAAVVVVRPGATLHLGDEVIQLDRAVVRLDAAAAEDIAVTAARARQAAIDDARKVSSVLAEIDELIDSGASAAVLAERLAIAAARLDTPQPVVTALRKAIDSGDPAKIRAALAAQTRKAKLTPTDAAGVVARYDPKVHKPAPGSTLKPGDPIVIVRPGHTATIGDELVQLDKAVVEEWTEADAIAAAERVLAGRPTAAALSKAKIKKSGTVSTRAVKFDPTKHDLPSLSPTGEGGLSTVPEIRAVQLENRIRAAYRSLAQRGNSYVRFADLKERMPDTSSEDFAAALKRLAATQGDGGWSLVEEADRRRIRPRDRETEIKHLGEPMHLLAMSDPSPRSLPSVTVPAGAKVRVVEPGYTVTHGGETIVVRKARVEVVEAPEPFPRPGVAALPRVDRVPGVPGAVAKGTNPSFGTTSSFDAPTYRAQGQAGERWTPDLGPLPSGAFEENCTNVVCAWDMRMRGFDIQAAPLDVLDKYGYAAGRTYAEVDELLAAAYRLPSGKPHGRALKGQQWRSFDEIDAEIIEGWPDGGRGIMFVGKHVFNVTKVRGKVQYIEAQFDANTTRVVTTLYRRKYRGADWGTGRQEAKVVRLDDLEPADGVLQTVTPAVP